LHPTPTFNQKQYDEFSETIRRIHTYKENSSITSKPLDEIKEPIIYRKMKFIQQHQTIYTRTINNQHIENYIYNTKDQIANKFESLLLTKINNLQPNERKALKILRNQKNIIIKPADKNLGLAILNKEDYILVDQCTGMLSTNTYKLLQNFPQTYATNYKTISSNTKITTKLYNIR
jgi:hypothetical protein